jgi:hypothetical protein
MAKHTVQHPHCKIKSSTNYYNCPRIEEALECKLLDFHTKQLYTDNYFIDYILIIGNMFRHYIYRVTKKGKQFNEQYTDKQNLIFETILKIYPNN